MLASRLIPCTWLSSTWMSWGCCRNVTVQIMSHGTRWGQMSLQIKHWALCSANGVILNLLSRGWFHFPKAICDISTFKTLWYSCHELCSSLLTETQWIYRNLIGQETKPGHIADIAPGDEKQEMPVMCENLRFLWKAWHFSYHTQVKTWEQGHLSKRLKYLIHAHKWKHFSMLLDKMDYTPTNITFQWNLRPPKGVPHDILTTWCKALLSHCLHLYWHVST